MALSSGRTYVGFGFGAIQAGLFLYEAHRSGAFDRLVVAEVLPDRVAALRRAGGYFAINVAHEDGVEAVEIGPVEILNPAVDADRAQLAAAIADASEVGTAIPSVNYYTGDGPQSLHRILAAGLARKVTLGGPQAVVYAAENDNHAAEKLEVAVCAAIGERSTAPVTAEQLHQRVRFLNTVIGKMSGLARGDGGLVPVTLGDDQSDGQAFLVEAFNTILISRVDLPLLNGEPPFQRGIAVFEEKDDLLPFEEAKLYGHNAVHALAAYLSYHLGLTHIGDVRGVPGLMDFLRAAFIQESGAALVRKYGGVDALFTPTGLAHYANDLLERMTNPFLQDTIARVGRDPARKLGWHDRLIGTMRLALNQGIRPTRFARGAAAAVEALYAEKDERFSPTDPVAKTLYQLWQETQPDPGEAQALVDLITEARHALQINKDELFI